jgi:hypothetical protein
MRLVTLTVGKAADCSFEMGSAPGFEFVRAASYVSRTMRTARRRDDRYANAS